MNFVRMGNLDLDEFKVQLGYKNFDGSVLSFPLLKIDVLERACLYDVVEKATLNVYVTYAVEIVCVMRSGHTVRIGGTCTPHEYQCLHPIAKNIK